jgi:hypothetical protein
MAAKRTKQPREAKEVASAVSTGAGGPLFQYRVAALYLANLLTGLPTTLGLSGGQVTSLRMEARYAGVHTDDIYLSLEGAAGTWQQFVQCKLSLDAVASDTEFTESLNAAWRDFLGTGPLNAASDFIVIATKAPASGSVAAAKRICELARASVDVADLKLKLETKGLLKAQHLRTWEALCEVSKAARGDAFSEQELYALLCKMRFDVHDLAVDTSQEITLVKALLRGSDSDAGELIWTGLVGYCHEQGQQVGTITKATWERTATRELQDAVERVTTNQGELATATALMAKRIQLQMELVKTEFPNGVHLPRSELCAKLLQALDAQKLVVVVGGPGVGKSAVVASLAPLLRESAPLFFFRADELDHSSLNAALIASGTPGGLLALDASLEAHPKTVVILDSMEKALEFQRKGALEELLELLRRHQDAKLLVTTRSYALNPLCINLLHSFSRSIVDVPLLSDQELDKALDGSNLSEAQHSDPKLRDALKTPFFLRLALAYLAYTGNLKNSGTEDIREWLLRERIAPSDDFASGLAERRRAAFDDICFRRTSKFSQFVDAPGDAQAVAALLRDGVVALDTAGRVAPAHDVFEDWSLFFRIEREVSSVEYDWATLFPRLGTHAGLRRAFRTWLAERSAARVPEALSLFDYCVSTQSEAPAIWRDEAFIGVLRSPACDEILRQHEQALCQSDFALLRRMAHLLRVACKGPSEVDVGETAVDSESWRESRLRLMMATPIGTGWTSVVRIVHEHLAELPESAWSWVAQLLNDAIGQNDEWYRPSALTKLVFDIADFYTSRQNDGWYHEQNAEKSLFQLLLGTCGADTARTNELMSGLIEAVKSTEKRRNRRAEERLKLATSIEHSRALAFFCPEMLWDAFSSLYLRDDHQPDEFNQRINKEDAFGLSSLAAHGFFPAGPTQGPFRHLLALNPAKGALFIVRMVNEAAAAYARNHPLEVMELEPERGPNDKPHLHSWEFWTAYRGHGVTSYLLNSALMALEERLLVDAPSSPKRVTKYLEWILDNGTSAMTTGLVASMLCAHPELMSAKLVSVFKAPEFFLSDKARSINESSSLAPMLGFTTMDRLRQQERIASNNLPHRQTDLETLALQLQLEQSPFTSEIQAIFDARASAFKGEPEHQSWQFALKRMDARGLRLGSVVEASDGNQYRTLEPAELPPEMQEASEAARLSLARMNRRSGLTLWASAILRESDAAKGQENRFESAESALSELQSLQSSGDTDEDFTFGSIEVEVAAGIAIKWGGTPGEATDWARQVLINAATKPVSSEERLGLPRGRIHVARALLPLLRTSPSDAKLFPAVASLACSIHREIRSAVAQVVRMEFWSDHRELAEELTMGMANYANGVAAALSHQYPKRQEALERVPTDAHAWLMQRLSGCKGTAPPLLKPLPNAADHIIALEAVAPAISWSWRDDALSQLVHLAISEEEESPMRRIGNGHGSLEYSDLKAVARLFSTRLFAAEAGDYATWKALLADCINKAPKFSGAVFEEALIAEDRSGFARTSRFWDVWAVGTVACFPEKSLRKQSRSYHSYHEELLRVLLFSSIPWRDDAHHLKVFDANPSFASKALAEVGDTYDGFYNCVQMVAGIARDVSTPRVLIALRDAITRAPADLFNDFNCQWYVETICRVAVHDHRPIVLSEARLRQATLDVLDLLVDAGSSLAFQLRDYLATSPAIKQDASPS